MGISVVTPPASEPLSLVEAKDHLRITQANEDGMIAGYILAAREYIENDTHLKLVTQTLDYTVDDGWPCVSARGYYRTRIEFPFKPVASITSVSYVDAAGATQVLASNQYVLRNDGPVHFIEPAYDITWPTVRAQTAAITVRLVAGAAAASVPQALLQAMRLLVANQYAQREPLAVGVAPSELPLGLEAFLSPHRFTRF